MTGWRHLAIVACAARVVHAQPAPTADDYHRAGEAAYKSGDFAAAVSAFEQAYRLRPRPQTLFSLAQAYRHVYVEHHEPGVLLRAVELYRTYLAEVPRGGRSGDARELLANLDPLAQLVAHENPNVRATSFPAKTQLLVWSAVEGARVRMDGAPPVALPHVVELVPGPHALALAAPGHADASVQVTAVEHQLVPIEARLTPLPSVLSIATDPGARLVIDGTPRATVRGQFQLAPGTHRIWLGARGRTPEERVITLEPGATRHLDVALAASPRRVRARWLFAAAGALAASGLASYGYARYRGSEAQELHAQLDHRAWTTAEYATYADDRAAVDRWQTASVGLLVTSALVSTLATWWWVDDVPSPSAR
ncbi:MAG TPA: hypothetical protein VM513_28620 [Kofleriaceae bacterium]|nr:hypothetical protein [Kofleriaceae bacterium]